MSLMSDLTPLNLLEEKKKFFQNTQYNPQFKYVRSFSTEELTQWGIPKIKLVEYSLEKLRTGYHDEYKGEFISREYIEKEIRRFNESYQVAEPIQVEFSEKFVARCRVSSRKIFFRLPVQYTKEIFDDLYRHELETHILRRLNHSMNWEPLTHTDEKHRRTEEGLASLHTFLFRKNKVMNKSYLGYSSTGLAQQKSFVETFHELVGIGLAESKAWNLTVRAKRGMTDTSLPGGITKDICYFEGILLVWDWIMNGKNDPKDLYLGRISLDEVDDYKKRTPKGTIYYPSFFDDMPKYLENVAEIGRINNFDQLITEVKS